MWGTKTRQERGYGAAWDKVRQLALARDCGLCQLCQAKGRPMIATEVDHIVSKARGGSDALDNLQAICKPCHTQKTAEEVGKKRRPQIGADGWPVQE